MDQRVTRASPSFDIACDAAIVGAGPAGLFAAELLGAAGYAVAVFDRMPSPARKFLMAGRGGLNLTHSEDFEAFAGRYGAASAWMRPHLEAFAPAALVQWAEGLGQAMFTGSSGRVFPRAMKASPLLRAWLARLSGLGVTIHLRHAWTGWEGEALSFADADGRAVRVTARAALLAAGGASWPRLGSDGGWAAPLRARGVVMRPFAPANSGMRVAWSDHFRERFAGAPLNGVVLSHGGRAVRGEAMVSRYGLEGGAIYALSAALRETAAREGAAPLAIDLRPGLDIETVAARLARGPAGQSVATRLRKGLHLAPVAAGLLREAAGGPLPSEAMELARLVKAARLTTTGPEGLDRAISSAGGIALDEVDDAMMLKRLPGVFAAGEMLDWEAPTGGYLLQGCFATAHAAARGMIARLRAP